MEEKSVVKTGIDNGLLGRDHRHTIRKSTPQMRVITILRLWAGTEQKIAGNIEKTRNEREDSENAKTQDSNEMFNCDCAHVPLCLGRQQGTYSSARPEVRIEMLDEGIAGGPE